MLLEGLFEAAEPHFLASGKRDSARILANMFVEWASPTPSSCGVFALRGTIPWDVILFGSQLPCSWVPSYLQNGNILAARTFINTYTSALSKSLLLAKNSRITVGESEEVVMTKDQVVNFAQMAVLTCQRAQGDKNKAMRESWVRLCGTYQSRGGLLASPEVRAVCIFDPSFDPFWLSCLSPWMRSAPFILRYRLPAIKLRIHLVTCSRRSSVGRLKVKLSKEFYHLRLLRTLLHLGWIRYIIVLSAILWCWHILSVLFLTRYPVILILQYWKHVIFETRMGRLERYAAWRHGIPRAPRLLSLIVLILKHFHFFSVVDWRRRIQDILYVQSWDYLNYSTCGGISCASRSLVSKGLNKNTFSI